MAQVEQLSSLTFDQVVEVARRAFAEDQLELVHTVCLLGLTRFPDAAPLLTVLGWVYARRADLANAETTFRQALCHDGGSVDAHSGLAAVLAAKGNPAEAELHYQRALGRNPRDQRTLFNYGCTLMSLGRYGAAMGILEQAVAIDPSQVDALHNLAIAAAQLGQWETAVETCERALALESGAWQVRMLRGMSRIALGSLAEGWDDYEARVQSQEYYTRRLGLPSWGGLADRKQSIAIIPEQGIGTQILFASCLADLAGHVSNCTLGCEPRLLRLFRRSFPSVHVVAGGVLPVLAKCGLFDCYVMAGSLPRVFRRTQQDFSGASYLAAGSNARERWRQRLDALGPGAKVGVSWGGGGHQADTGHRRTEAGDWLPLLSLPEIEWVNLQYDASPGELDAWRQAAGGRFHDWHDFDKKHDLENLAGLVSQLDLVITAVNSNVHLAGALGVPTWTLVPVGGEWRWQARGENCLWHRSVRLFRQDRPDDWHSVFARLHGELAAHFAHRDDQSRHGAAA